MYRDQVIVVTGASRGVGRMLCEHFLEGGGTVIGISRSQSSLDVSGYRHFAADVADEKAIQDVFRAVKSEFGKVDALVNNAGIASSQFVLLMAKSAAQEVLETNVLGALVVTRECARLMMSKRYGRIVNISSMTVPLAPVGGAIYAASKSALTHFTKTLAKELADYGITANVLGISAFATEMYQTLSKDKLDAMVQSLPQKRAATALDITNAIDFFLRRDSSAITGQVLYLGGAS